MVLESFELHYVRFIGLNFFLKKCGSFFHHGPQEFRYRLLSSERKMSASDCDKVKSINLILPSKLSTFNTETEN